MRLLRQGARGWWRPSETLGGQRKMQPDRVDPDLDVDRDLDVAEALAQTIGGLGVDTEPRHVDDYLALVTATARVEAGARALLRSAVDSARSAGATWSAVGATLGMSRQAAQKRFATGAAPSDAGLTRDERILGPVSAFDEMDELAIAGRYGWLKRRLDRPALAEPDAAG